MISKSVLFIVKLFIILTIYVFAKIVKMTSIIKSKKLQYS